MIRDLREVPFNPLHPLAGGPRQAQPCNRAESNSSRLIGVLRTLGLALVWAAGGVAWADCEVRPSADELEVRMAKAEAAFQDLDLVTFRATVDTLTTELPCTSTVLSTVQAARLHRLQGLRAFVQPDIPRAEQAFAASRRHTPDAALPADLAPANHPIRKHFTAWPVDDVGEVAVGKGSWTVDGLPAQLRPSRLPTLVQRTDGKAAVDTRYLWPGEGLAAPTPSAGAGRWLALGGGVVGVTAGLLYVGAVAAERDYQSADTAREDLDGLRARTNGLVWASGTSAVVGLGLGVAALTVAW